MRKKGEMSFMSRKRSRAMLSSHLSEAVKGPSRVPSSAMEKKGYSRNSEAVPIFHVVR